eukprot:scpid92888/ scgid8781/ 
MDGLSERLSRDEGQRFLDLFLGYVPQLSSFASGNGTALLATPGPIDAPLVFWGPNLFHQTATMSVCYRHGEGDEYVQSAVDVMQRLSALPHAYTLAKFGQATVANLLVGEMTAIASDLILSAVHRALGSIRLYVYLQVGPNGCKYVTVHQVILTMFDEV